MIKIRKFDLGNKKRYLSWDLETRIYRYAGQRRKLSLDKELRPSGIKVGVICPGGVKTEFAIGDGCTEESVAQSSMLDATDVAGAVLLACTQAPGSRIIEIQMRTMSESL